MLSQQEIAKKLGVSQPHISRLLKKGLKTLGNKLIENGIMELYDGNFLKKEKITKPNTRIRTHSDQ